MMSRTLSVLQRLSIPIALAIAIAIFGSLEPKSFLTISTFSSILGSDAVLVVLTLGLTLTLRAGDYDLSIAAVLTLSSMMIALLNVNYHVPIGWCMLAALATGLIVGFINGVLTVILEIDSLIVTLGVGTFLAGVVLWISADQTISGVSPALVNAVVGNRFLDFPFEFYYALALCIVLWYFFEFTGIGRRQLFVGKGPEVARLTGIPVSRVRIASFMLTGLISAFAGILYAGTAAGADSSSGLDLLLPAFAAAFLGSTTIVPGQFNPLGAFLAAYFLAIGITGLSIIGVENYVTDLFYGGALVVAVAVPQAVRRGLLSREQWRSRWRRDLAGRAQPAEPVGEEGVP
jgi:ribose transport system permease protein